MPNKEPSQVSNKSELQHDQSDEKTKEANEPVALLEELTLKLEDARSKADEHWDKLLRAQAELENLRKRNQRDLENAHKYGVEKFAAEILGVKDSLEMGLDAATDDADVVKLREGTELTLKLLVQMLDKFNIKEINPQGEAFDPEHQQAMTLQENAELPPNTVITVMQKGYLLNDRLLRPAMVIVSKRPGT